jgi:hypothetical protein
LATKKKHTGQKCFCRLKKKVLKIFSDFNGEERKGNRNWEFGTSVRCAYHLIYFAFVEEKYFFIIERVVYIHTRTARIDLILAVGTSVRGFLTSFPPQWGGFISFFTLLLQLQITNLFHVLRSLTDGKF